MRGDISKTLIDATRVRNHFEICVGQAGEQESNKICEIDEELVKEGKDTLSAIAIHESRFWKLMQPELGKEYLKRICCSRLKRCIFSC